MKTKIFCFNEFFCVYIVKLENLKQSTFVLSDVGGRLFFSLSNTAHLLLLLLVTVFILFESF